MAKKWSKKANGLVSVDTGQVIVIDPVRLFRHKAWQHLVACELRSTRTPSVQRQGCMREAIAKIGGAASGAFLIVDTPDGDGRFEVQVRLKRSRTSR